MCMEDIRVMRRTVSRIVRRAVGLTVGEFVPYNKDRVALSISSLPALNLFLTTDLTQTAQAGFCVPNLTGPVNWNIQDHGAIVKGPIFASVSGFAADTAYYMETVLEEQ